MVILLAKHSLSVEGIKYFNEQWFPELKVELASWAGFISIQTYPDAEDHTCMRVILKFKDDPSLYAWVRTEKHADFVKRLDPFRLQQWLVAKIEQDNDSEINEDDVIWRTPQ